MKDFNKETVNADNPVTKTTPRVIIEVLIRVLVTARVEHIPSIWMNTGLLYHKLSLAIATQLF
jgi:hypothetical protein